MRRWRVNHEHLSCSRSRNVGNFIHATPFRRENEQRFPVGTAKHARETAAISIDRLQRLATFADADATFVRNVGVPDRAIGVEADAVGNARAEIGPDSSVRQTAIQSDVECGDPFAMGLSNDQRSIVGSYGHAIWKGDVVGYLSRRTIGCDERDDSRSAFT